MVVPGETLAVLVVVALIGVAALSVVVAVQSSRLRRLRRAYAGALGRHRREDVFQAVGRQADDLAMVRSDIEIVHANTERLRDLLRGSVSRVGMVRYDAFEDMGGALSFSAALLDGHGDGLVLSAINGRTETRCYAKPVVGGASDHNLSHEEVAAIDAAVGGRVADVEPEPVGRRRRAS